MIAREHESGPCESVRRAAPHVVQLHLRAGQHALHLDLIRIEREHRRKGQGHAAMAALTAYADRYGLTLALTPDDVLGTPKRALVRFYASHGFTPNTDSRILDTMIRRPVQ
jgi:GNAT superfamily N-acetyltransferase